LQDQDLSNQLKRAFAACQASLKLQGKNGFGMLTADNYDKYLLETYLFPSATRYLSGLTEEKRKVWIPGHDDGDSKMIVMAVPK
jgi:hypothetical protein